MTNRLVVKTQHQGTQTASSIPTDQIFSDTENKDLLVVGWKVPNVAVGRPEPESPIGILTNQDPEDWDLGSGLDA